MPEPATPLLKSGGAHPLLRLAARAAWLAHGLLLAATAAAAREPTREPILRVEAGMHTTLIRRIAVDAPRQRLVTCSDDKTVRVWQMPEARLIATLRPPIDTGHEGQLFAVAVSPDGKTIVTGGWTGWDWDGAASLYFFDTASGELIRRVGGFKDAIHALLWTRDGEHLVVGLQGRGGLLKLAAADGRVVASDTQYLDKIMELDERADGIVSVVALDGMARLYGRDFTLLGRRAVPGGSKPSSARFSPDGRWLAVGFIDKPAITVLQTRDLAEAYRPDLAAAREQASFTSVAWSSDGRYLYAGGDWRGDPGRGGANPLYRWADGGRGALQAIPLADNRITEVQQMPGGAIAFAAEDPGLGIVGADGRRVAWRGPEIIDFAQAHGRIELSANGGVVRYPVQRGGSTLHGFSPLLPGDQALNAPPRSEVFGPVSQAAGLDLQGWKDGFEPTLNGRRIKLDEYELSRSYALAPARRAVLLGTEWSLRLLDAQANELWSVKLSAVANAVNVSRDGRVAVAALSDGTLRWYRMDSGREELAYFPHRNGTDWIAWVPDGYYMSSVAGDAYVGWHLNRSRDLAADFHRAVQFDRILYRPDAVAAAFRAMAGAGTRKAALGALGADFEIAKLREIAPPRLVLRTLELAAGSDGRARATLELTAERSTLDIKDLAVFVNNIPVTSAAERRIAAGEGQRLARRFAVDLRDRANQIRVEAFNGVAMGVTEAFVGLPEGTRIAAPTGDLYVLAVGVNAFPRLPQRMHLAYAARDAQELAATLQAKSTGLYGRVHVRLLTDDTETKPDRAAVMQALQFVQQARPEDTAVIFLASHGVSDTAGNYYFVPRDARPEDVQAIDQKGKTPATLLPWTAFFDTLRATAGRRLLIVDTCQARSIEGRFEPHSLMKRSSASLFSLMVASKGDEESQEYPAGRHGLFTYALLQALGGDADADRDGVVTLGEAFDAARPVVERLRDKRVGAQTPQIVVPAGLVGTPLVKSGP